MLVYTKFGIQTQPMLTSDGRTGCVLVISFNAVSLNMIVSIICRRKFEIERIAILIYYACELNPVYLFIKRLAKLFCRLFWRSVD
jgi:hypothetical protein